MSNNFLDKTGLSYFWSKVKAYVGQYLPLSGGTVTGNVNFEQKIKMSGASGGIVWTFLGDNFFNKYPFIRNQPDTNPDASPSVYTVIQIGVADNPDDLSSGYESVVLSGIKDPIHDDQAANKYYVDNSVSAAKPMLRTVTLVATAWTNNEDALNFQLVEVIGAITDSTKQAIDVTPNSSTDRDNAISAGVWCIGQADDTLLFQCDTVPTSDITFNIKLQEATI